jgi:hypothetical protein
MHYFISHNTLSTSSQYSVKSCRYVCVYICMYSWEFSGVTTVQAKFPDIVYAIDLNV